MKKQLISAALCAAVLCAACAPASAVAPAASTPVPSLAMAAETVATTASPSVLLGNESIHLEEYAAGDELETLLATELTQLPKLPEGVTGKITVQREQLQADGTTKWTTLFSGSEVELASFEPHSNGVYLYSITSDGIEYRFNLHTELTPRVRLSSNGALLGETLTIYVDYANGMTVSGKTDLSRQPKFYETDDTTMALLPVSYNVAVGTYSLTITVDNGNSEPLTFSYEIKANKRDFVVQNLRVNNSTASSTINNDFANREWNEKIEPLKYITDSQKYWDGKFIMPVQGRITTQFGTIRYTNGSKNASRHGALDIAAGTGTPVPASNAGRVIFAQYIQMSGNVVVIEHGLGLKTWYFHMSEIKTKEGDMVKKGDIIGLVGATGFVTGPHLHFGMSVNDVYINPYTAINNGIG